MILNQWCAVEAAIKWDHGKLAKDIKHWQYFEKPKELIHKKKNIHLNYSQINFHNWTIALAYEEKTSFNPGIICCSNNFLVFFSSKQFFILCFFPSIIIWFPYF